MICTFQGKLIAFFLLAMTLLEGDSGESDSSDFQTCSMHIFDKNDGIKAAIMWGLKLNEQQCTHWVKYRLYQVLIDLTLIHFLHSQSTLN